MAMATERQPVLTAPDREQQQQPQQPPALGESAKHESSQAAGFRGFEYFSRRDYNEYKDASRAYFAEKNANPSSWLGDATPPASPRHSLDESRSAPDGLSHSSNDRQSRSAKRILGLQRPWFWTLLVIAIVVIVVAIGVGVGVGVGTKRTTNGSKTASGASIASDSTGSLTSTSSATGGVMRETPSSSPTPTSSTQAPLATTEATMGCPGVNGTVYEVPGSTKKFLQLCGVDYGKEDGAVDIRNVYTENSETCIDNCAGTTGCTGCGWGFIEGDKGPPYRCWLKKKVDNEPHSADRTWHFAVLL